MRKDIKGYLVQVLSESVSLRISGNIRGLRWLERHLRQGREVSGAEQLKTAQKLPWRCPLSLCLETHCVALNTHGKLLCFEWFIGTRDGHTGPKTFENNVSQDATTSIIYTCLVQAVEMAGNRSLQSSVKLPSTPRSRAADLPLGCVSCVYRACYKTSA
ncbi:uncharacterized protein LOC110834109 [Zootermopsis nevadensis]|uniref:uncharacterized protein LOC110834109 n=1 Tax=Zootermopsis nevadensis TaxID=136037 RepID=UPI000B8E30F1|nr:uncharacterized protein LOC110834109 [Zootermopsis nevadensis]